MHERDQDAADAARVVAGEEQAFDGIVRRWQRRLIGLAWRFCRDRALAEDMAQEAFVKAFRFLPGYRGESAFSTWLVVVALNVYRSRLRAAGPPCADLDAARLVAAGPGLLERLEDRQRAELVRRAVLGLPRRYREALVLFYFEERDVSETARVLGIAEGTLKSRLHRARELLKRRCGPLLAPLADTGAKEE